MIKRLWCWLWGHASPLGGPALVYCGRCGWFPPPTISADHRKVVSDLLTACELFEQWMLCGQPAPYSDSQILGIVRRAIANAKAKDSGAAS